MTFTIELEVSELGHSILKRLVKIVNPEHMKITNTVADNGGGCTENYCNGCPTCEPMEDE